MYNYVQWKKNGNYSNTLPLIGVYPTKGIVRAIILHNKKYKPHFRYFIKKHIKGYCLYGK